MRKLGLAAVLAGAALLMGAALAAAQPSIIVNPGGSSGQFQYNCGGRFCGSTELTTGTLSAILELGETNTYASTKTFTDSVEIQGRLLISWGGGAGSLIVGRDPMENPYGNCAGMACFWGGGGQILWNTWDTIGFSQDNTATRAPGTIQATTLTLDATDVEVLHDLNVSGDLFVNGVEITPSNADGVEIGVATKALNVAIAAETAARIAADYTLGASTKATNADVAAEIARAQAAEALLQPLDADLTDLADGSLTGSKVGSGVPAANIANGTMGNVNTGGTAALATALAANGTNAASGRIALGVDASGNAETGGVDTTPTNGSTSTITSDAVFDALALKQDLDADLTDLADGSLTGSKVGSGVPAANIADGTMGNVNTGGNAATATALASNPSDAVSGYVARGIAANGTVEPALVDALAVNGSTNPVQSDALFDHAALSGTSAHGAVTTNTANQIVARDSSGSISVQNVTAAAGITASTAVVTSSGTFGTATPGHSNLTVKANNSTLSGAVAFGGYQNFASSASVANAALQQLGTFSLPAGTLNVDGDYLFVTCIATTAAGSTAKVLTVGFGSTNLQTTGTTTSSTGFRATAIIGRVSSNKQNYSANQLSAASSGGVLEASGSLTETDSSAIAITCKGSNAAGTAGSITVIGMIVEYHPAP